MPESILDRIVTAAQLVLALSAGVILILAAVVAIDQIARAPWW